VIEKIADALERREITTASLLLEQLQQQQPENPWLQFYRARLDEMQGRLAQAEQLYREILRVSINSKVSAQARQGLQRLVDLEKNQKEAAIANAKIEPGGEELGLLILEAIEPAAKATAALKLSQIMEIDPYTARLQLPSRSWKLYRTSALGELEFYVSALKQENIPCFCVSIAQIARIEVKLVDYFQCIEPPAISVSSTRHKDPDTIIFDWKQVSQKVEGLVPLFEAVVDTDKRGQTYRKTQILDYAKFCDLHLANENTIVRLCDRVYQFERGINLSASFDRIAPTKSTTANKNWHNLNQLLKQHFSKNVVWSEFTTFAETAMNFPEVLKQIQPQFNLLRREETYWDNAFELYSRLVFARYDRQNKFF
jgi:hypothetical protein